MAEGVKPANVLFFFIKVSKGKESNDLLVLLYCRRRQTISLMSSCVRMRVLRLKMYFTQVCVSEKSARCMYQKT